METKSAERNCESSEWKPWINLQIAWAKSVSAGLMDVAAWRWFRARRPVTLKETLCNVEEMLVRHQRRTEDDGFIDRLTQPRIEG